MSATRGEGMDAEHDRDFVLNSGGGSHFQQEESECYVQSPVPSAECVSGIGNSKTRNSFTCLLPLKSSHGQQSQPL